VTASPPTLAGFQSFITNVMAIPTSALPLTAPIIQIVYDVALDTVLLVIACAAPGQYTWAVYNLAAHLLLMNAPDQTGQNYFVHYRSEMKLNTFVPGVISASADESTSQTMEVTEAMKNLTIDQLLMLRTVYGRNYLSVAQKFGPGMWGIT
jgi:hypothetical protein